ncbi:unnamed protein product [Taenia asiatica]|uniref:Ubiquitin-conjugating enzyme E2C-binding protein n=1 Tax=Taenia asiatica TaxID=60517 RepID=A0A0R3VTH5_TAEAS|nr:unnamed protein product [Taenia asiatica]
MSVTSDGCVSSPPPTPAKETGGEQHHSNNPPFSISFPAFTLLNRRRRITCKFCDLPIGYADIGMTHLEAIRCQKASDCKIASEGSKYESVSIACPINVSLTPCQQTTCESSDTVDPYLTWIIEDMGKNTFTADKVVCDGCKSSLGARITSYERNKGDLEEQACDPPPKREERFHWFSFSLERIKVEPLFGLVGLRELSSWYHGGERFFHSFQAIEDSGELSNSSRTWMRPHERVEQSNNLDKEVVNETWPFLLMDLVRANELPQGLWTTWREVRWHIWTIWTLSSRNPRMMALVMTLY